MLKYKVITDELLSQISSGALAPGARLPSTRELEARYGVSQITALRVFKELNSSGKVVCRRGAGYFVRTDTDDDVLSGSSRIFCAFRPPKTINSFDNFGTRIMCGIIDSATEHHRSLEFSRVRLNWDSKGLLYDELSESIAKEISHLRDKPSAVILDSMFTDQQLKSQILPVCKGIPVVLCGRRSSESVISVYPNRRAIAEELGCLAYQSRADKYLICPISSLFDGIDFCSRYVESLTSHGIKEDSIVYLPSCLDTQEPLDLLFNGLEQDIRSGLRLCFFAPHDYMALLIHSELSERGIVLGRDAALLSCGNLERVRSLTPRLTTVELYPEAMGAEAVHAVINVGQAYKRHVHTPHSLILNETWSISK